MDKHVINGLPNGTFGSYELLDRASAATIITRALGININSSEKPSFKDSQNHWGAPYTAAAEKAGIVKGVGNGLFNPSGKVTRAEMATMLVNAYKLQSPAKSEKKTIFNDLKGHWGEKYASILIDLGISKGTDNGWQPDKLVNRVKVAQLTAKADALQNRGGGSLNSSKEKISNKKEEYNVEKQIMRVINNNPKHIVMENEYTELIKIFNKLQSEINERIRELIIPGHKKKRSPFIKRLLKKY